ncbi:class I SAM-dependent methyltransferase [Chthonobacter albigriseus]|uniref:class I SAM-dependent methyltransferase n=1 Tax=Chthonobacter albigriseus TaxID=1683161 RepID=UPI0015EF5BC3|nr:class I SAM-dependent methyltransferase [Chthonobacter albigriseus]
MARIAECRCCGSTDIETVWDLGLQPIANDLKNPGTDPASEAKFPLEVAFCKSCALMQITETIPPDVLFNADYPYYSSVSKHLLEHSKAHVDSLLAERTLGPDSLVVEVASNDGYLLKNFLAAGVPVLGVDPASGPAQTANAAGIPTINTFFSRRVAEKLAAEGKLADVVIANNVAAHVDQINDFIDGFRIILKDDGIAEIEVAYLLDLVEKVAFDTIYHEHLFYHSLIALKALFKHNGLHLNDALRIEMHGGSIRVRVSKQEGESERLKALLAHEYALGMDKVDFYRGFSQRMEETRSNLEALLLKLKAEGKRIAAYGAAAKGATLLNYLRLPKGTLEYVVDLNPHKVGKLLPGVLLTIQPVDILPNDVPDFVLLLAWNFGREIIAQQSAIAQLGSRFIMPVPLPRIVRETSEV